MKKPLFAVLPLVLLLGLTAGAQEKKQKDAPPLIPDKNLEAAVRQEVFDKRDNTKPLTEEDLRNVYVLDGNKQGIKSLKGLEKCTNLREIKLSGNAIADLSPLKELTYVQSLYLANNKIKDVAPLATLTKLQHLELQGNEIVSIDALASLSNMASLYLADNKIKDIAPLAKLTKLASLDLEGNEISDIGPISSINRLMSLNLRGNQITDLAPLGTQTQLTFLTLDNNKVSDLGPLVAWCRKDAEGDQRFAPFLRLYLEGNPLSDAAKSTQLAALKEIGVRLNPKQ